ncbi:MAG: hypothetical protein ABI318_12435 [Chthoniobacteraceae bacterium]
MTPRPARALPIFLVLSLLQAAACLAVDLRHRSASNSGQFVIYCDDRNVRGRVVSFVEEVKAEVLRTLHENDGWQFPIVVTIEPADPAQAQAAPVAIQLVSTVAGPKIDVAVRVSDDPAKVFLERHIVHALLLEIAYRDRPPIRLGERYAEPPWWLTEGILQGIRSHAGQRDPDIFKSIVNTEKLPSLGKILTQPPVQLDTAAGAVDRACALALTGALLQLPGGPANVGRFLRAWPDAHGDALALLAKQFPILGESPQALAKWWTLQLAALGKSDEWRGLSPTEADAELRTLLTFEISAGKPPRNERFALADFGKYIKLPGARPALRLAQVKIVTLSTKAHILFRPILSEYEEICGLLANGKTKGIAERLAAADRFRASILQRHGLITDYMNWYEATQTPGSTGEFDRYLRAVEIHDAKKNLPAAPVDPKIADYLDSLEQDFAPLRPNMLPGTETAGSAGR